VSARAWFGFVALSWLALACTRSEAELDKIFDSRTPSASASASARRRSPHPPGENPFGLPSRPLGAAAGDVVLAPSRVALEQAFELGPDSQTFVYYAAVVEETGPLETRLRYPTHERRTLPNAVIVPLRRGALASPGDVVLTTQNAGSGLVRAIAIGGEPGSPRVRYLDPSFQKEKLAGPDIAPQVLPRDTFHVLREPGEPGTTLACSEGQSQSAVIALKLVDERRLVLGFAGRLRVVSAAACTPLPIVPDVRSGQTARFPLLLQLGQGQVQSVDSASGRVWIRSDFAGETRDVAVGFGNVLPGPAETRK
jgi:hypothetical protein